MISPKSKESAKRTEQAHQSAEPKKFNLRYKKVYICYFFI